MGDFLKNDDFNKEVEHRLIDIEKNKIWLANEVNNITGLKIDVSYLCKVLRGKRNSKRVVSSVNEILGLND
jgi:hypothetical protein